LDAAKLEMLATDLELQAIKAMDRNLDQQTYDALKAQAQAYRELGIAKKGGAAKEAAIDLEKANAEAAKKAQEDWERASEQINNTLTDALLRGFEDGKGFASNFRDTLKNMFRTLVLRPIISFVVQPIGNLIQGAIGGLLGGGQGGAGSLLGTASNLNSAWGMLNGTGTGLSGIGYNMLAGLPGSVGYGMLPGMTVGSQQAAMLAAQTQAFGGAGLQATAGAAQTAQGASWMAGNAAGIAAVAAPLIIGSLIERNARDRFSGAAYATSGGNDPFANTIAGSTGFDYLTGDLPDRAALLARLGELGAPMEAISDWNDRALLRLMESAAADNSEFGINWTSRVRDMRDTPDFYRGAGYAHPEELGWWHNKDNANLSTDPALIQASRDIALSIIGPLEGIGALIGDEAAYRATVGFANRGEGNGLWAGMNLQRDGQNVADWVNTDDFHSVGEAVRAMYSTALGTLDSFDLPGWADKQVTDARTALDALSGDKIGEQAAALYQQATGGISATFAAIEKMINLFPDFAEASQDAVYALGELTGGLDNLASAYGSYLSNFYSEEERRQLMFKELDSELDKLGIDTIPRTRAEFRELVSAQDLSTEAGREAFTVLMKLSGGFAEFVDAAESAADNARERIDSIFGQISKLWDEQISNWSKLSSEAESVFDAAIKAAKDLRGQVADTRQWDARAASVWIDQALAGLRATGALPDSKELADAIAAARGGLDMSQYDTLADMERDQLILAGKLKEIGDSAEVQMSFAEQQVQLLEQQRDYWRQQIDLLNATGETITSIDQGIEYLADYVREQTAIKAAEEAEKEASREAARRAAPSISPGGWGGGGGGGGGGQYQTTITRTINWDTGEYVYPDGSGGTLSTEELEHYRRILDGELDPTRIISDLYLVPRHADGGRYAGGLELVGERGPELINFASPGHVYTAVQTRDMMRGDNAELIAELRELRARLDKIERNTAVLPQTHDVIDRVTAGGNAMLTEAA
ncbi:MAG: EF-hand protein, partial [Pseudomonadota bacterium]|nr:EF-hand protein [Pseudomonadota bacterium]